MSSPLEELAGTLRVWHNGDWWTIGGAGGGDGGGGPGFDPAAIGTILPNVTPGSGSAQTAALQSACDAARATGRTVLLPPGEIVTADVTVPDDAPLRIRGAGREQTRLRLASGANGFVFRFTPSAGVYPVVDFAGFTIDGNAPNNTSGGCIYAEAAVQSRFDSLHLMRARDVALWLDGGAAGQTGHHNWVTRCLLDNLRDVAGANQQGIRMRASDENYIAFNDIENWGGALATPGPEPYAIKDWSGLQLIIGNTFVGGMEAIRIQDGTLTKIIGNMFDGVGMAGVHASGTQNLIALNSFMDGSSYSAGRDAQVQLDGGARATLVQGNLFFVSTSGQVRNCFLEIPWGGIDTSLVMGNTVRITGSLFGGNDPIELHGANSIKALNPGQPNVPSLEGPAGPQGAPGSVGPGAVYFGDTPPPNPVAGMVWFGPAGWTQ